MSDQPVSGFGIPTVVPLAQAHQHALSSEDSTEPELEVLAQFIRTQVETAVAANDAVTLSSMGIQPQTALAIERSAPSLRRSMYREMAKGACVSFHPSVISNIAASVETLNHAHNLLDQFISMNAPVPCITTFFAISAREVRAKRALHGQVLRPGRPASGTDAQIALIRELLEPKEALSADDFLELLDATDMSPSRQWGIIRDLLSLPKSPIQRIAQYAL
jgi:hypothetical protein